MTRITDDWVNDPAPSAVMSALGGRAFFVGGCVRNSLMGLPISDIDLATPLVPKDVEQRLHEAEIKTVPTGLQHGTQTAVVDGIGIEVTTFRADVTTDGRRAEVAFTEDMAVDAGRRDFTMNALYARADGEVIDPIGGLPDLQARRLRFIGEAHDRIREDYLRILRFFRFHAWYGAHDIDPDGLAACAELADGIDGLARERIGWEFRKLLLAADPAPSVASMAQSGILARCLPGADQSYLAPLVHLEQQAGLAASWQRRLAALGGQNLVDALRLSRAEAQSLDRLMQALGNPSAPAPAAYRFGADAALSAALIRAAMSDGVVPEGLDHEIQRGVAQTFPLQAADLIAAGMQPGPDLGTALAKAETQWIGSGFSLDKDALISDALTGS